MTISGDLITRIGARIDAEGGPQSCHIWQSSGAGHYPTIADDHGWPISVRREIARHRLERYDADARVLMTCRTPRCVNWRHMTQRGYVSQRAEDGHIERMTPEAVAAVRADYSSGVTGHGYAAVAARHGLPIATVRRIVAS